MSTPTSPHSIFNTLKKMSKIFDYRLISRTAKSSIFTIFLFAGIFFIIYAENLVSNLNITPMNLRGGEIFRAPPTSQPNEIESQLLPTAIGTVEIESEAGDPLIPPFNATTEERISWFRRKLPELDILNSNELSHKFHGRVLEFFNNECSVQFFMVWLSPAFTFGPREFLGMDTLFKANPHACLTIVSRTMDSIYGYQILKPLLDLGYKILAVTPDLPFLVKNTPAESWLDEMKNGTKDPGQIPLTINLSNLIRLAVLYKYGGVYLDSDFIILKDFAGLRNAIGAQSGYEVIKGWTRINGAVMIFDIKHPILADFLEEFATTFNGSKWGQNGHLLLSRVIQRARARPDNNFAVLPPKAFYPVDWNKIHKLFKKPENEMESKWVEVTLRGLNQSYAIHLWNSSGRELTIGDGSVMDRLIADHCIICQHINTLEEKLSS